MKICVVEAELLHADRRADGHRHGEASSLFLKFCERAYNL
jgi:hypothetical protein